jgi:hypothetical protein
LNLKLGWWNTALSPKGEDRAEPLDFDIAERVLINLLTDEAVDFFALGEVSQSDITRIKQLTDKLGLTLLSGHMEAGPRSQFSTCFIANQSFESISVDRLHVVSIGASNYRLAQQLTLVPRGSKSIHVLASHWPSRQYCERDAPARATLGDRLRERVDAVLKSEEKASIVLMGDYNDEPHDRSLSDHLRATRDIDLVRNKPDLLYNPFWREYSHSPIDGVKIAPPVSRGSYFHRPGPLFKWRNFDQMIFSASFVTDGDWQLDESKTGIASLRWYVEVVASARSKFDHVPILAVLKRNPNG